MESYEKKYKDALERAKKLYEQGTITESLGHIFPELKESEDEKIRKSIHIYLDWLDGRKDYAPRGKYTIRDMISWLEKQGETFTKKDVDDAYLQGISDTKYELGKQGEQKPDWNKKDDINLGKAIWYVENPAPMAVKDSMLVEWLKSIKQRLS